jgi:hypothetical protein
MTELTRDNIRKRSVRIRITGEGELPQLVAHEIINGIESIGRKAIDWSGSRPTETDPDVNHVYLTLVPEKNNGRTDKQS